MCSMGDFTGGETWIYDGTGPVEIALEEECAGFLPGTVLRGTLHNSRNVWVKFDGRVPHKTLPFRGTRYACVFFVHKAATYARKELLCDLRSLNFVVPKTP